MTPNRRPLAPRFVVEVRGQEPFIARYDRAVREYQRQTEKHGSARVKFYAAKEGQ